MQQSNIVPIGDSTPTRNDILNALEKSIIHFQEALDLAAKHPQISESDIAALEQAISQANKVYTNICMLQFVYGTDREITPLTPLKLKTNIPRNP